MSEASIHMLEHNLQVTAAMSGIERSYPIDRSILRELNFFFGDFPVISPDEPIPPGYTSAAHCFLWAPCQRAVLHGKYQTGAIVSMQLRFDGLFGFSGGLVDGAETPSAAVLREMREEINLDTDRFKVTESDHVIGHRLDQRKLCTNLYALRVSESEMLNIEKNVFGCRDYGDETLGMVRVPLYTMDDGRGGFPQFLAQHFSGSAKAQLTYALVRLGILKLDYVKKSLEASEVAAK